jgi:surface antigen
MKLFQENSGAHTRSGTITAGLLLFAVVGFTALSAQANWHWMRGSAISDFGDSDWVLLKEAAQLVLNDKPDNEQVNWTNPDTGNRGSIIAIVTFSHDGKRCRRAAMRNQTFRGREDMAAYSLCQQADGEWAFVSESVLRETVVEP